jgi:hypothetical protein
MPMNRPRRSRASKLSLDQEAVQKTVILDQIRGHDLIRQGSCEQLADETVFYRLRPERLALSFQGFSEAFAHRAVLSWMTARPAVEKSVSGMSGLARRPAKKTAGRIAIPSPA